MPMGKSRLARSFAVAILCAMVTLASNVLTVSPQEIEAAIAA